MLRDFEGASVIAPLNSTFFINNWRIVQMAIIKFINKSLFNVKASEYINDGTVSTNIDIKTVPTSEGKTKNVCRIGIPGNCIGGINSIEDAVDIISQDGNFVHKNKLIEKYKNVTTTLALANDSAPSSAYYIIAIPYNGNIDNVDISAENSAVELVNATTLKTESFAMSEKSKLKFAKILYLIIKCQTLTADVNINFLCKSYPKSDTGMKKIERLLKLVITGDCMDNVIPDVIDTTSEDLVPNEDGTYDSMVVKFSQLITSKNADDLSCPAAVNMCAHEPYAIRYTGIIRDKRDTGDHHKSDKNPRKNTKANKFYVSDKNDETKKANAHAKCINKLNKAKGKFAE